MPIMKEFMLNLKETTLHHWIFYFQIACNY